MNNRTEIVLPPVVILAAGRGTRMGELTENQQKTMLPLQGKPLLEITMERFVKEGFTNFVFVVGYRKENIISHFEHLRKVNELYKNVNVTYTPQENIKGGTADAVRVCEDDVKRLGCGSSNESSNEVFVLVYGDVVPSRNTVLTLKENSSISQPIMTVRTVPDPERYGVVEIDNVWVTGIHEKCENPPTNLINSGMYVLPNLIFDYIHRTPLSQRGEYELTTSIEMLIETHPKWLIWRYIDEENLDVGTASEYNKFNEQVK